MKHTIALVLVALPLSGCFTSPVSRADAEPATNVVYTTVSKTSTGAASLTVRRDSGLFGVACDHIVRLDGKMIASLRPSEQVVVYPEAGEHVLEASLAGVWCGGTQSAGMPITVQSGQARAARTSMSGFFNLSISPAPDDQPAGTRATAPQGIEPPAQPRVGAAKPEAKRVLEGTHAFQVERMREALACSSAPRATLLGKSAGAENYTVACTNGDSLAVRCEFGSCRVLQ